ncbi:MAG: prepilin-type N-terminal cleavage/methylation domain-containing protein [bacterium]
MKQEQGFTLIEVIISLTILAMIMGVIMGGFRLSTRSWEAGEKRLDEQQRMRCVFDILIQDIKSCMGILRPPKFETDAAGEATFDRNRQRWTVVFFGEAHKLTLITTASGIDRQLKKGTLRYVSYYLGEDEEKPGMNMEESPWLSQYPPPLDEETPAPQVHRYSLYPDVIDITFQYYGIKKIAGEVVEIDAEPEWYEDWNPLELVESGEKYLLNLPQRVRVTIHRKPEGEAREEEKDIVTSFDIPIPVVERRENVIPGQGQG